MLCSDIWGSLKGLKKIKFKKLKNLTGIRDNCREQRKSFKKITIIRKMIHNIVSKKQNQNVLKQERSELSVKSD